MLTSLIISDLHLTNVEGDKVNFFNQFCEDHSSKADQLFILGDLFNSWQGEGVIVEINGEKALINIPSLAMMTQIKFKSKVTIEDKVKLKVGSINLFERSVNFKPL